MTLVMGILNLTPDSFSDGGRFLPESAAAGVDVERAVSEARRLVSQGAHIIDLGGESTRPGADPVEPDEEQRRVLPVLEALLVQGFAADRETAAPEEDVLRLSVDTRHPATARAALQLAGDRACGLIINDVSGLLTDEAMPPLVAEYGCSIVVTHNRGDSKTMQEKTDYDGTASPALLSGLERQGLAVDGLADAPGVVVVVLSELLGVRQRYLDAGVAPERVILDPGIGFAKTHQQNWELIRNLHRFTALEAGGMRHRVLFGASRKGFLGRLLAEADSGLRPSGEGDTATAALSLYAARAGCWAVRVHAPRPTADVLQVMSAVGGLGPFA
ncbi:dihydropteroate synthase [Nesterenkonia muleiensis]|uniref:dihydropteroate synthase n=1 Tax=Nesterenkonia muleiensis TaxID=2282648 RepID=UPI000E77155E|nr:dihydropteroate synthase [Nesterenkonia muleiensis]